MILQHIAQTIHRRQTVSGIAASAAVVERWFDSPAGKKVLAQQQRAIDQALSCLFGYHIVQLSALPAANVCQSSRIAHRFRVGLSCESSDLVSEFEALPLADESVDVAVLHHALDFSQNPHQLLNEASRIIISNGHLVIVGFNPVSLTGVVKPFAQIASSNEIWKRHSLSRHRLNDWFKLLGFDVVTQYTSHCKLPISLHLPARINRHIQKPFGHFYCLVARKSIASVRPIKPVWDAGLLKGVRKGVKIAPQPVAPQNAARIIKKRQDKKTDGSNL